MISALTQRAKKFVFQWVRRIPKVRRMIEEERNKVQVRIEDDLNKFTSTMEVYNQLPKQGCTTEEILKEAKIYLDLGNNA